MGEINSSIWVREMVQSGLSVQNTGLTLPTSALSRLQLTPGTLIQARVLSVQDQQATLQIQGQTLPARTTLPLQPGLQLTLLVQFSQNQWRLIPQNPSQSPQTTLPATLQQLTPLLAPPAQSPQTQLYTLLQQLPAALQAVAQPLLEKLQQQQLKPDNRLRPAILKAALENSGVFFENRLLQQQPVQQDIKGLLFRLLNAAENKQDKATIAQIKKILRGLSHQQARNLVDDWLGIPLFFAPNSGFREGVLWFRQPEKTAAAQDTQHAWQAILQLDFNTQGPFEALLSYCEKEDTLEIQLWCAHPALQAVIKAHEDRLKEKLPKARIYWLNAPPSQQLNPPVSLNLKV